MIMAKNDDVLYVTKEGLDKLKSELKDLLEVKRPEVANRIRNAREMGDISENSEYDSAMQEKSYVEGRIAELEEIIKSARTSDNSANDTVGVGCMVTVHIEGTEETFHIVGAPEANPIEKKISHQSPLGTALVGKKVGQTVDVEAPIGNLTYKILKVEY